VRDPVELTCSEIVELVTDYTCHELDGTDRARVEQHLFACTWCMTYVSQMNRTVELTARLKEPAAVDEGALATLFRKAIRKG
jgi:anti-sigma factor RsiW